MNFKTDLYRAYLKGHEAAFVGFGTFKIINGQIKLTYDVKIDNYQIFNLASEISSYNYE